MRAALVLGLLLAVSCGDSGVVCPPAPTPVPKPPPPAPHVITEVIAHPNGYWMWRVTDLDQGVVCYLGTGSGMSVSCLPLVAKKAEPIILRRGIRDPHEEAQNRLEQDRL